MERKRSRIVKLALLSTASILVGGCGCDEKQGANGPAIDPVLAKKAVAAGTSVVVSDAFLQAAGMIASGPGSGLSAPISAARIGYVVDQADETADVTSHESGLRASNTGTGNGTSTTRHHYHYHSSPGIGWFLWGHMLGSASARSGTPYTPSRNYGTTPRPFQAPRSGGSSYAGGSSSGRSGSSSNTGGSVSRGGFGSSGSSHASGGSS